MKFPWNKPKESTEDESEPMGTEIDESAPETEEIEDKSADVEPKAQQVQEPSTVEDDQNKIAELLVKNDIPTVIRVEHKIEIPQDVKDEISDLFEVNKKVKPFEPQKEDENYVMRLANFFYFTNKPEESIKLYDEIIKKKPSKMSAHNNKGVVLDSLHRYDEALVCFNKALEAAPENVHVLANKAVTLYRKNSYDEALSNLDSALKLDPKYMIAVVLKANTLYRQGRQREALEAYDMALRQDPTNSELFYNKACLYSMEKREGDALTSLEKAVRIDPIWKSLAAKDKDFENIRESAKFRELVR